MNLHQIASPYVGAVNPLIPVTLKASTGVASVTPSGKQVPGYAAPVAMLGQVQPMSTRDLAQVEGLNLGGVKWKIYLNGAANSVVRPEAKGGDLIGIASGPHQGTWLVVCVLEQFPDWCSAAMAQQNGG